MVQTMVPKRLRHKDKDYVFKCTDITSCASATIYTLYVPYSADGQLIGTVANQ